MGTGWYPILGYLEGPSWNPIFSTDQTNPIRETMPMVPADPVADRKLLCWRGTRVPRESQGSPSHTLNLAVGCVCLSGKTLANTLGQIGCK